MSLRDLTWCRGCLQKTVRIDRLEAEVQRLKAKLRERERQLAEGPFGSNTPSSQEPFKENSLPERQARQGGAKPGHVGHGRKPPPPSVEVLPPEPVAAPPCCPDCHGPLVPHDTVPRQVHDLIPARRVYRTYQLARSRCLHCHQVVTAPAPGVLPRHALSNRLLATALSEAYAEGLTLGQVARRLLLPRSALLAASQRVAGQLAAVYDHLIADFRAARVRHADETTWRDNGANTYAWLFATTLVSVFALRPTRGEFVPLGICGDAPLEGSLNVDRYVA